MAIVKTIKRELTTEAPGAQETLFNRIGGSPALDAAVDLFYEKVMKTPQVSMFFETTNLKAQRGKLKTFLAMAFGDPVKYTSKSLERAHAPMVAKGLDESHFNIVAGLLKETLEELAVPTELIEEMLTIAASTKDDVLGTKNKIQKSMQTKNLFQEKANSSSGGSSDGLEKKLEQLERDFNRNLMALEEAVDAVIQIDRNKMITFFNKAAEQMFGFAKHEVIGQNVKTIVPIEHRGNHDNYVDSNIRTSVNRVIGAGRDLEATKKDGTPFWINLSLSKTQVGDDVQYTAFIKNITDDRFNRERNNQILEQAVDSVITIDADKTVLFFNKSAENLFGFKREEVIGKNVKMIVPIEHRANHDQYVNNNIQTSVNKVIGKSRDLEMTRKDGTRFWGNLSLSKVDVNGKLQYTAFIKDITEERFNRERNNQILEQAVDSVITIDENRNVLFFNKAAEKMFGFNREEVLGQNVKMIVPIEHRANHDKYVTNNIQTGVNKVVGAGRDLPMTRRDGSKFWGNLSLSKVDVDGKLQYTAFIKDITEERFNRERNNQILEQAVDSVITIDENKNVLFFNKAAEKMFGFSREEVLGKNIKMVVPVEHRANHDQYVNNNIQTGVNKVVGSGRDLPMSRKDGAKFWGNLSLSKVDIDGKLQYTAFIKDITAQKEAEQQQSDIINVVKGIAAGDLSQRVSNGTGLGLEINQAFDNLSNVLTNIRQGADVVAKSSDLLQKKTMDMQRNTTEVATSISQMAKGAQDQASRTDASSKLMNHVMTSSNEMEKKANLINKAAEKGLESSNQGMKTVKILVNNMTGIKESANQTSQSINVLTKRTEEIGRTLNVITDIASQTNLLALNAAIEAARAGDAGRGFAVVAEEIRKLAEDSRKSAVEIEKIIGDVQKDTQNAGKAIEAMESSVKEGNKSSIEAEVIFQEIAKSSEETFGASKEIQAATVTQKESISSVVKNFEQIVVVSEETAAGTQQVASSSQQMSNGMSEIAKAGDELSAVAAELQAGVQQFKLKK